MLQGPHQCMFHSLERASAPVGVLFQGRYRGQSCWTWQGMVCKSLRLWPHPWRWALHNTLVHIAAPVHPPVLHPGHPQHHQAAFDHRSSMARWACLFHTDCFLWLQVLESLCMEEMVWSFDTRSKLGVWSCPSTVLSHVLACFGTSTKCLGEIYLVSGRGSCASLDVESGNELPEPKSILKCLVLVFCRIEMEALFVASFLSSIFKPACNRLLLIWRLWSVLPKTTKANL